VYAGLCCNVHVACAIVKIIYNLPLCAHSVIPPSPLTYYDGGARVVVCAL